MTPDPFPWADPALKARLLADPGGYLAEFGFPAPAGLPESVLHDAVRIVSLVWVDGRVVPRDEFRIDPGDEGLLFARGVWESTRTVNGVPWLWPEHATRLIETAARLGFDLAPARVPDAAQVAAFVRGLARTDVLVRVNATAGRPGKPGRVWMTAGFRPAPPAPLRLKTAPTTVRPDQPELVWKTFQYAPRLRLGREAAAAGFDSVLLVDAAGNVQEAAHANVFFRRPDGWVTPPAAGGVLLPGTVRAYLLRHAAVAIREEPVPVASLGEMREVFATNSNVGLVPVVRIDAHAYPIGEETRRLAEWAEAEAARAGR